MCIMSTGYLVAGEPVLLFGKLYSGVDTTAWPLGLSFPSSLITDMCEMSYLDMAYPFLIDYDTALQYMRDCVSSNIKARLLYCEARTVCKVRPIPQFTKKNKMTFLGYDYAYPSGDYYSAILNDIIYRDSSLANNWKKHINEFGLLQNEEDVKAFINERNKLVLKEELLYEKGCFLVFHLSEALVSPDLLL